MRIRTKLSLTMLTLIGAVVLAVALSISAAQRSALAALRVQALTEGVERLARESLDNRDPLMILSYLLYMQKEHPELAYAAVTNDGHTTTLGAKRPDLAFWTGNVGPRRGVGAELGFDRRVLHEEVERAMGPLSRRTASIAGLFMVLGWIAAFLLARRLTGPLAALACAVDAVGKGDLDTAFSSAGGDEVGALVKSFNAMKAHLKDHLLFREDLLHTLTHELRTPLGALKSCLESRREKDDDLRTMEAAVLRMERALENALGLFRRGRASAVNRKVVWIDDVLRETSRIFTPAASARKIDLELPARTVTKYLYADDELLRQIVVNLISNALKYTPDGGRVRVGLEDDDANVRFWVSDTGRGIEAAEIPGLFSESAPGLGLSIVQRAARSLGGAVTVASEPGRGSTFTVAFPKAVYGGKAS